MENIFKKLYPKAKKYLEDRKRLKKLLSKASDKSIKLKDKEKRNAFSEDLKFSISLVKDWSTNNYREIPKKSIISIVVAIIYFVIPTDLIPDFILGTGFLDDAAILSYMFSLIKDDLDNYKKYKYDIEINQTMKKDLLTGFYEIDKYHKDKSYIFFNFIAFFKNNEFSKESLIAFIKKNKEEFYVKGIDKDNINLFIENNITTTNKKSSFLLYPITVYSILNYQEDNEIFFKNIKDIISISYHNEEVEELGILYSTIVRKIFQGEKDKVKLLLQHDFNELTFKSKRAFELGLGSYIKEESNHNEINTKIIGDDIESILSCLYKADSYNELENEKNEYEYSCFVLLLGAVFFGKNTTDNYNYKIEKILNKKDY